jgi:glycosyltransferase involved in cell wall biosynthesis
MSTDSARPLVSVVIPFYDCPFVDQAVESALRQTYSNVEIIVVDDGSSAYRHLLGPYHSQIHYITKPNGGTASALNAGIRRASGDYIAWLSSDDRFYPFKIERQLAYMQERGALISWTDFDLIDRNNAVLEHSLAVKFSTAAEFVRSLYTFNPINGCTVMMHRSVPQRIGLFDETLICTQDYDYWLRVILNGIDFHFMVETLTAYRWHDNMGTIRLMERTNAEIQIVLNRYVHRLNELSAFLDRTREGV